MSKKPGEYILWVILVAIFIAPLIYVFFLCQSHGFWDNVMSNLLATGLALVVGIPIALWLDRKIKYREGKAQYKVDRLKEANILKLIKEEINYSYLTLFLGGKKGNAHSLTLQPLKSDLWDSFVAGEEIKYIEEPDLLNRIVSAYYVLKLVKNIEGQAYIALRTSAIQFTNADGTKKNSAQLLLEDARGFDVLFENSTKEALRVIDKRFVALEKYEN